MNTDRPKTEAPIADRLAERTVAPPTPSLLDAPLPGPTSAARGPERGATHGPASVAPAHQGAPPRETPDLSLGGFFAQHKALVDERRHHLERVGMMPNHVAALRMPDLDEAPRAPAVLAETLPPVNQADGEAKPMAEPRKAPAMPEGEVQ